MNFAEANAQVGQCLRISSTGVTTKYAHKSDSQDWYFASGGFSVWGNGVVSIDSAGNFSMNFSLDYFDRYNWDGGKSVKIGGVTVTDQAMGEFHRQGLAKEFDMVGQINRTITWQRGGSPTIK